MVTRARKNAERRAKDENNYSADTTAVSSKSNIPQKEPGTSVSLDQTPSSSTPSKNLHHSHTPNITSTEENNPDHGPRTTGNNPTQTKVRTIAKRRAKDKNNRLWRPHHPPKQTQLHPHNIQHQTRG